MKNRLQRILAYVRDQSLTVIFIMGIISAVTFIVMSFALNEQEGDSIQLKLSTRQAQLIESIRSYVYILAHASDIEKQRELRSHIIAQITEFQDVHLALLYGDKFVPEGTRIVRVQGTLSSDLRPVYYDPPYELDKKVNEYITNVKSLLSTSGEITPDLPAVHYILSNAHEELIKALESAVSIYQKSHEYKFRWAQNLQTTTFFLTLTSLFIVGVFILRPLVGRLEESMVNLREEKDFSDNVLNTSQALIVGLDREMKISLLNIYAQERTGWHESEVLRSDFCGIFIPEEERQKLVSLFENMVEGSETYENEIETRLIVRTEELIDVIWHMTTIRDPKSNEPNLLLLTGIDITDRKQAEVQLQGALDELAQLSSRLQEEVNLAAILQRSILPSSEIEMPGIQGQAQLLTSSEVGGDYYDYFQIGGYQTVVMVGDVSGHGVAAGTMVSAAKAGVYTLIHDQITQPSEILRSMNETMRATAHEVLLMTMCCFSLDARSGQLSFANAGHVLPYLRRRGTGQWQMVEGHGLPLGKDSDFDYGVGEIHLDIDVGDRLLIYTDALVEEESPLGEQFGYERLESILDRYGDTEPEVLRSHILQALREHCGQEAFSDDVTIVIFDHVGRVTEGLATDTDTSDVLRVSESSYRDRELHLPRISKQYVAFLAEGDFADLLPRFSQDGIRRVLPQHDPFYRKLGWDQILAQHHDTATDDLYALTPGTLEQRQFQLTHSDDKLFIMEELQAWLTEQVPDNTDHVDSLVVLLDEMVENSLYAAPRDGQDRTYFEKGAARDLATGEILRIDVAVGEGILGLMVTDSWGTLTPASFLRFITQTMEEGIEAGVGGAGLYMMWRISDYLQVRVHPHRKSQVTALWDLTRPLEIGLRSGFQFLYHNEYNETVKHDELSVY